MPAMIGAEKVPNQAKAEGVVEVKVGRGARVRAPALEVKAEREMTIS